MTTSFISITKKQLLFNYYNLTYLIPRANILDAIEQAMAAAYKKDYGKKGQIIRAKFDLETGQTDFFQIKIVVDDTIAKIEEDDSDKIME